MQSPGGKITRSIYGLKIKNQKSKIKNFGKEKVQIPTGVKNGSENIFLSKHEAPVDSKKHSIRLQPTSAPTAHSSTHLNLHTIPFYTT
jgi:hypothetical protein